MSFRQYILDFVSLAIENKAAKEADRIYLQNKILALIGEDLLEDAPDDDEVNMTTDSLFLCDALVDRAITNGILETRNLLKEQLVAELMDILTPMPSQINEIFWKNYQTDKTKATDEFFRLSKQNDYIKTRDIARNVAYCAPSKYGELEITINLSKPEKDPKQIAAEKNAPSVGYPKCLLCVENEGYLGRMNHPARTNHRLINLDLQGEEWAFQYSPYAYYNEHSIVLSKEHRSMKVSKASLSRMLSFVEQFPHYFIGSNADLPIVGGSILSHDHYQAGRHEFPMAKAEINQALLFENFPTVTGGIVKWPMSVIRIASADKNEVLDCAAHIFEIWDNYSDLSVDVVAHHNDGTRHHTITPIIRRRGKLFEIDVVLRDNHTTPEFPDGVFHPHQDVQHIKKENIGLIEVMGLAILPPRLIEEMQTVEDFILNKTHQVAEIHMDWAQELRVEYNGSDDVHQFVQQKIADVFCRVLEDAGVYKTDAVGQEAFLKFTKACGFDKN